jgi:hypothetical protein
MKALLLALLMGTNAMAFGQDKVGHFVGSYAISLSTSVYMNEKVDAPELVGIGLAMAVGLGKELTDDKFSCGDLGADFLGALTGAIFHYSVRW